MNGSSTRSPSAVERKTSTDFPVEFLERYDFGDIPLWLAEVLLRHEEPSFDNAARALAWGCDLTNEKKLCPMLIQGAGHENLDVRLWAVRALGELEETAASPRPLLVDILKKEPAGHLRPSDVTRWIAVRGLWLRLLGGQIEQRRAETHPLAE